jgi:hypothetical protein
MKKINSGHLMRPANVPKHTRFRMFEVCPVGSFSSFFFSLTSISSFFRFRMSIFQLVYFVIVFISDTLGFDFGDSYFFKVFFLLVVIDQIISKN